MCALDYSTGLRPKRNDKSERQKTIATLQQDHDSESEEYKKVTDAVFTWGRPIDLGLDSGDKMKIAMDGPVDLGDLLVHIHLSPCLSMMIIYSSFSQISQLRSHEDISSFLGTFCTTF